MAESLMERMRHSSHLDGNNLAYVEALYEEWLEDAERVPQSWRDYFAGLAAKDAASDLPHRGVIEYFERLGRNRLKARPARESTRVETVHQRLQMQVQDLIAAYRHRGHKRARIDPLGLMARPAMPVLDLAYHGLTPAHLEESFSPGNFQFGAPSARLSELIGALEETYCGSIGSEYMHIVDAGEQRWVQQRLEAVRARPNLSPAEQRVILERLTAAEGLEKYLHGRFPGTKRFGLEGGESLIPLLHETLQRLGVHGVLETVIGMAHRGRLNVLVNILGKQPHQLFEEFEGRAPSRDAVGSGDVKYHQGFSSNVMTPGGEMHLALGFNPSHLEIVGPVVEGSVRARQDRRQDRTGDRVVPILIHGDAAFAGQGVVMETFQMSQTRGFRTGGTIHVIVNNQIGFTTHRQEDARSTEYCTEVAKMVQAPIFHVNGDDPEAVLFVTRLAVDYRMEFQKDVVIDLVCYRRRGHNEAEEPAKTQPLMYRRIRELPTTRALYVDRLVKSGVLAQLEAETMAERYRQSLESGHQVALGTVEQPDTQLFVDWSPYVGKAWTEPADTRLPREHFLQLAARVGALPDGFSLHRQVERVREERARMAAGAAPVNWGYAEIMAYASLVDAGYPVRLTGQDVGVGTFSHRHVVYHDQETGAAWSALAQLRDDVAFDVYDSLLSEEAVLAFEYGYASTAPNALVVWEAQFGDFANGAQVVIDQFISSGETKWARLCGLTLLLPHGQEGAGPEHSSARLERFLQLCAEHNMQVCVPSSPAQMFHLLRRQVMRAARKPLIALTPKSLLRHRLAVSSLEELFDGHFHAVLAEKDPLDPVRVTRLVLCSGKVYYDLLEVRRERNLGHVAIVRLEQLYPFPATELAQVLSPYRNLEKVVWCQEEPVNQGAWYPSQHQMRRVIQQHDANLYLEYAGREAFAAPAAGHPGLHDAQQRRLVEDALGLARE